MTVPPPVIQATLPDKDSNIVPPVCKIFAACSPRRCLRHEQPSSSRPSGANFPNGIDCLFCVDNTTPENVKARLAAIKCKAAV
jgi:hypothetical protein